MNRFIGTITILTILYEREVRARRHGELRLRRDDQHQRHHA